MLGQNELEERCRSIRKKVLRAMDINQRPDRLKHLRQAQDELTILVEMEDGTRHGRPRADEATIGVPGGRQLSKRGRPSL